MATERKSDEERLREIREQDQRDWEASIDEEFRLEAQWEDDQRNIQWDDE
jgi:hypothetical protein